MLNPGMGEGAHGCWTCSPLAELPPAGAPPSLSLLPATELPSSSAQFLTEVMERQTRILHSITMLEERLCLNGIVAKFGALSSHSYMSGSADGLLKTLKPETPGEVDKLNHELEVNSQCGTQVRLEAILRAAGAQHFKFVRVPSDYYEHSYDYRREALGAASVEHLCKSIVMVNTQAAQEVVNCSDLKNSKYYVVVVQYATRLNAEKVRQFIHSLNEGKIPKKRFNMRLAPEEDSHALTGFEHNAVTPIGMKTPIPVILSDAIVRLQPDFFWLGGGEPDLKLGIKTSEFIRVVRPFITDCTH